MADLYGQVEQPLGPVDLGGVLVVRRFVRPVLPQVDAAAPVEVLCRTREDPQVVPVTQQVAKPQPIEVDEAFLRLACKVQLARLLRRDLRFHKDGEGLDHRPAQAQRAAPAADRDPFYVEAALLGGHACRRAQQRVLHELARQLAAVLLLLPHDAGMPVAIRSYQRHVAITVPGERDAREDAARAGIAQVRKPFDIDGIGLGPVVDGVVTCARVAARDPQPAIVHGQRLDIHLLVRMAQVHEVAEDEAAVITQLAVAVGRQPLDGMAFVPGQEQRIARPCAGGQVVDGVVPLMRIARQVDPEMTDRFTRGGEVVSAGEGLRFDHLHD